MAISDVTAEHYQAVFFIGGKGAMFDFPNNHYIQNLVKNMYESGKVIAAICHGPAAFINVKLSDGRHLLTNKKVSSFTNKEELFLIPDAETIFPFLLEDKLRGQGATPVVGEIYLEQVTHDDNLITGQNPWSTWKTAETIVTQLGYQPTQRKKSATEYANNILNSYHENGFSIASQQLVKLINDPKKTVDKHFMLIHSFVAAMQWEIGVSIDYLRLLHLTRP